jgi:D-beta-D-heptose 7-phosphate kinase/D-beta-D-heptose 1-phosphate adenosyltransferase
MFDFSKRLSQLSRARVLCIGDLMLDSYFYGEVERISPEAPAPVIAVRREELIIGGAGNVARNVASLGASCTFIGVIGNDEAGEKLKVAFGDESNIDAQLIADASRPTTRKVRFVSEHFSTHLLRADWEATRPVGNDIESSIIDRLSAALPKTGAVVISDYAKGVVTPGLIRSAIDGARAASKPVVVDPKGLDFTIYRGATLITPNRKELAVATRRPAETDGDIAAAAAMLAEMLDSEAVLVTLSEAGMVLVPRGQPLIHIPAYPVKVLDVSGAGDTVVATLGAMLAAGAGFEEAARAANAAAAVVVGKRGTAVASGAELRGRILPAAALAAEVKILSDGSELDRRIESWRGEGLRIGFSNGCFDLLHPGHVKLLTEARAACDRLVVGLNSDSSVLRLKGPGRPVQSERARAEVLAALAAVDLVVLFNEETPIDLIARIKPQVLIKGADYRLDQVVGRELVQASGGEVILVDLVPGYSSSRIVEQSRAGALSRGAGKK